MATAPALTHIEKASAIFARATSAEIAEGITTDYSLAMDYYVMLADVDRVPTHEALEEIIEAIADGEIELDDLRDMQFTLNDGKIASINTDGLEYEADQYPVSNNFGAFLEHLVIEQ